MSAARDKRLVAIMASHGIERPVELLRVTRKVNARYGHMPLSLACAIQEQESSGGENVFGRDPVRPPQRRGGRVTRARYVVYKRLRKLGYGMQGVGPNQLTWFAYQDEADRLGGCWRPNINRYVGLCQLAMQIGAHGYRPGITAYNGTGAAADRYAREVIAKTATWHRRLERA